MGFDPIGVTPGYDTTLRTDGNKGFLEVHDGRRRRDEVINRHGQFRFERPAMYFLEEHGYGPFRSSLFSSEVYADSPWVISFLFRASYLIAIEETEAELDHFLNHRTDLSR